MHQKPGGKVALKSLMKVASVSFFGQNSQCADSVQMQTLEFRFNTQKSRCVRLE